MKFKQWTNAANILDEIFNQRDSLIRSKVMDLDNLNYFKVNVKKAVEKAIYKIRVSFNFLITFLN